jgi:probable F420-dependent oxidoreductase
MQVGFGLPYLHHVAHQVNRVADFAREAEGAGAASLWVGDRNFAAVNPKVGAGGVGKAIPSEYRTAADPFLVLGVAAAATKRVRLGSHVLIAPLYAPVQLARSLTTLDLMSDGRLISGFGVGWSPEEYEAANLDFHKRGSRMDELLDALELLWTNDQAEYHGRYIELPLQYSPLHPVQKPRPPFYLGGLSARALKRIGERADGWLPMCAPPAYVDADAVMAQRARIESFATAAGRDPAKIDTIMRVNPAEGTPVGQVADVITMMAERTGIDHFMVEYMSAPDVDSSLEQLTRTMERVMRG